VIEKPNITDDKIISVLRENYSIHVTAVEFLPLGWDATSWSYRIEAENGDNFLKLRKGLPNPAGILIPRFLKQQGIGQVMAPLSSAGGKAWELVDDFHFILYPFIRGKRVMDIGMSDGHWVEFGSVMKRLHTTKLTPDLARQIRRETFTSQRLEWDKKIHAQVMACEYSDPFQRELAEFWRENHATIATILERSELLSGRMQAAHLEFVLCHADIHTANVLRTEDDKIFIVDWDETMLAPKERDLMFALESIFGDRMEGRAERLFFEGYGEPEIDQVSLAYYRYNWCVEDMGGFAEHIFTEENIGEETKKSSIWWFKSLFEHENSIQLALNTDIGF
jgi:spectinomycin phosphotransferase